MKEYKIPVIWQEWGVMTIKANSLEEAKIIAVKEGPLPIGEFIEDSLEVDDESIILEMNP